MREYKEYTNINIAAVRQQQQQRQQRRRWYQRRPQEEQCIWLGGEARPPSPLTPAQFQTQ